MSGLLVGGLLWLVLAALVGRLVLYGWRRRARAARFRHDGRFYTRRSDGSFAGDDGNVATGAMAGILAAAYEQHCETSSLDTGGGDGGSCSSDGGGGDGGGGDSGGGGSD